jgi:hypothetical protein
MTFEQYWEQNGHCFIATTAPPNFQVAMKMRAANLWNAAIDAVDAYYDSDEQIDGVTVPTIASKGFDLAHLRARVTP